MNDKGSGFPHCIISMVAHLVLLCTILIAFSGVCLLKTLFLVFNDLVIFAHFLSTYKIFIAKRKWAAGG